MNTSAKLPWQLGISHYEYTRRLSEQISKIYRSVGEFYSLMDATDIARSLPAKHKSPSVKQQRQLSWGKFTNNRLQLSYELNLLIRGIFLRFSNLSKHRLSLAIVSASLQRIFVLTKRFDGAFDDPVEWVAIDVARNLEQTISNRVLHVDKLAFIV